MFMGSHEKQIFWKSPKTITISIFSFTYLVNHLMKGSVFHPQFSLDTGLLR